MKKIVLSTLLILGLFWAGVAEARAASNFTLTPSSGTFSVGDQIKVTVGIDSGTDKVYTADLFMVFDVSKLEFVDATSILKDPPVFPFTKGANNFDNTAGTFNVSLGPVSSTSDGSAIAKGDLVALTFKAKAAGTGTLSFACTGGNVNDTNIINQDITDVVNCAANQSGSYTIQAGDSGSVGTTTTTTTTTTAVATPTKAPSALPKTGVLTPTVTLLVMGLVGIIASAFFLL
ncbi:MAG: cohesin domain-containing protein [Candidatus Shapirobacteria bacterium]|nr:cohesin domain-containing protein [Candidatus Shapirobacteria bacterium]